MAYAAAIAAIAAAVVGAYGVRQSGKAQEAQMQSQAQADEYNARVQEVNAQTVLQQAGAREDVQRRKNRQLVAAARAAGAENTGLTGTTVGVIEQTAAEAETDALSIRYGGLLESRGLMGDASLSRYQGKANRKAGLATGRNANLSSAASLLSSASSIYGSYGGPGKG